MENKWIPIIVLIIWIAVEAMLVVTARNQDRIRAEVVFKYDYCPYCGKDLKDYDR